MPKPSILAIDDLDSRRELIRLLNALTPVQRLLFLSRACLACRRIDPKCTAAPGIVSMRKLAQESLTDPRADMALSNEILLDLCILSCDWRLNLVQVAIDLELCVRRREVIETDWDALELLKQSSGHRQHPPLRESGIEISSTPPSRLSLG